MKKLLGILVLVLMWNNNAMASLIELEKCFISSGESWTQENYENNNIFGEVPKDLFLKNYKNWGMHKKTKKDYFKIDADRYPESDYITIGGSEYIKRTYGEETLKNLISIGLKYFPMLEKDVYSIDLKRGIITHLEIKTEEYVRHLNGIYKGKGSAYNLIRKKSIIEKYLIDTYAGGVIIAYPDNDEPEKYTATFDLEKILVTIEFSDGFTSTTVCKGGSSQDTEIAGSSGTAFFINSRGNLLTNNHVVQGCESQKINYFNEDYDVKIIATDKTLDLALLKASVRPKSYISFSKDEPKKRQIIIVAGYPLGEGLSDDLKINDGRISSLKGFENNSNEITVDLAINPGNSGGPIVNQKGQLVAIVVAGMSKDVTEGINFGIKASAAANFLKSNKISPSAGYMSFSMDDDELVELLEESTVYTFCN
jgi:hypothetical protein|tara:strand:- start:58 stop:1329 length:1272 start_codon:yes stop_codon:yes gene_type:complete